MERHLPKKHTKHWIGWLTLVIGLSVFVLVMLLL